MDITTSPADGAPPPAAPPLDGLYSIGDMARAFNVSPRALRFYEDRGLLTPRRDGSARLYDESQRRKLELILRGKRLGFTLTEIIGIVAAPEPAGDALALDARQIADQITHLLRRRDALDAAIAELRRTQDGLPPRETGRGLDDMSVEGRHRP